MGTGTLSGQCRYISNNMALFKVTLITNSKYVKAKFAHIYWVNFANTFGLWSAYEGIISWQIKVNLSGNTSSQISHVNFTYMRSKKVSWVKKGILSQKRYPESASYPGILPWYSVRIRVFKLDRTTQSELP